MKSRHLVSTLLLSLLVAACGSDKPAADKPTTSTRPENPTYDFGGNAQLNADVVVLPATATNNVVVSGSKLVFPKAGNEWMLTLPAGTPLAGGRSTNVFSSNNALGIMRKTRTVSSDATTITIETEQATLPDIISGELDLTKPASELTLINPIGVDLDTYFPGWNQTPLATCDVKGFCATPPDDGSAKPVTPPPGAPHVKYTPPAVLPGIAASGPIDREALRAQLTEAGPEYLGRYLTDLLTWASQIQEVRTKGLENLTDSELQVVIAVAANNLEAQNPKAAAAIRKLEALLLGPEGVALRATLASHNGPSSPGMQPQLFDWFVEKVTDFVDWVVETVEDLGTLEVRVSMGTLGKKKSNAFRLPFLSLKNVEKELGHVMVGIDANASVYAWAYLEPSANVKASFLGKRSFSASLKGEIGVGAGAELELEVKVGSNIKEDEKASLPENFAKKPTVPQSPWKMPLASLGPFAGPNLGPVPTTFRVDFFLRCEWELKANVKALAEAGVTVNTEFGAKYENGKWGPIGSFDWKPEKTIEVTFGGGAMARCGIEPGVSWLVADAAGPKVSLYGGLKAEASYEESCEQAKTNRPDSTVSLGVSAFAEVGVGGKLQFLNLDLAEIGPLPLAEVEIPLGSISKDFEGGGFGYCSAKCGFQGAACCSGSSACEDGLTCNASTNKCTTPPAPCGAVGEACCAGSQCNNGLACNASTNKCAVPSGPCGAFGEACCASGAECSVGLACDASSSKCNCATGVTCGSTCCGDGQICSNNTCVQPVLGCAQFKPPTENVLNAGCAANLSCPASCKNMKGGSGYYMIQPDTSKPAFLALCDMTYDGGGWTLVGYEPTNSPNPANSTGIMAQLSKESEGVDPIALAKLTAAGFTGPRFSYPAQYTEARLAWCPDTNTLKYQRFTTSADLFANTIANQPNASVSGEPLSGSNQMLQLSNFSSNDAALLALLKNTEDAAFCRAYAGGKIPGDTSWGVKQRAESSNECGCNGQSWQGTGSYYGGKGTGGNNDACTAQGGGWAGTAGNLVKKGGINTNEFYFWIR